MNAVEIEEAISLLAEQPFVPTEFPYAFLEAFGNKETTIKRLKTGNNNKSDIEGGVLQQNNIHIAICKEGKVQETLNMLRVSPATTRAKAKLILATDGKEFQAEDMNSGETVSCDYPAFHNYFGFFLPLAGISTVKQIRENAFDIKATSRLNKLYIELLRYNSEWSTAERRHDMNHFLGRLIFCFFAEDTNIFNGESLFTATVEQMSASDASDTHEIIGEIFRAMDTKLNERSTKKIKNWANRFPYVNGDLFSGSIETPKFTKIARSYLLHVGNLDWRKINPDIFGSMIQAVADEDERGTLGMHYTSVPNILKVLNPLFLDDLRAQLEEAGFNARKLLNLRKRIARIRVFDPACGSGNFLVIAYKQMREIEAEINKRRGESERPSEIPLTNFRGIEIRDFSCEIARLALIIAEYQCDVIYRGQKLAIAEFLPLNKENWVTCGNALRLEWLSICPPTGTGVKLFSNDLFSTPLHQAKIDFENEGGETYICGNPPYKGGTEQNDEQKSDMASIFANITNTWKSLDYIAGWFFKFSDYARHTNASCAFVSTNSICQGEQVARLWPLIFSRGQAISFAHTSFKWSNLAAHNAGVTVVIIGISSKNKKGSTIYSNDLNGQAISRSVDNINAYLVAGRDIIVKAETKPISKLAEMVNGNKAADGGHLILNTIDFRELLGFSPKASKYILPYYGSADFINGSARYCIWIEDKNLDEALNIHGIKERIVQVKKFRGKSEKELTREGASTPHRFQQVRQTGHETTFVIPRVSSEFRPYIPVGLLTKNSILADSAFGMFDVPLWNIALIASRVHLVWIKTVCGQLKTDFRYSNTLGWNTFPVPPLTTKNKEDLTASIEEILIERERHFPAAIADLYDPKNMPEDLRRAHDRNDEVLERIYIGRRFKNDTERLEKLFDLYNQMNTKVKSV